VIKNVEIINKVKNLTAGKPEMEKLVLSILDDESEGKQFARNGKPAIEKEARERE
jgi:hypothetical protein